mmetsp:Transcript_42259/g.30946  ORF Transcript_42259/g.30946 Transcript_42259/m.30946 type:complete len:93 (+) Transcript_42259:235-513(+)
METNNGFTEMSNEKGSTYVSKQKTKSVEKFPDTFPHYLLPSEVSSIPPNQQSPTKFSSKMSLLPHSQMKNPLLYPGLDEALRLEAREKETLE